MANQREVPREEGERLAKEFGCHFMEASAKTKTNVEEAFMDVLQQVIAVKDEIAGGKKRSGKSCVLQ
jgi:GTPase KRas protein